jgi:hypothetical protein
VNIYITDLAAPGCRQPGLYYYRHRGFWEGLIFRKIEKKEDEGNHQKKENKKCLVKSPREGKKGNAKRQIEKHQKERRALSRSMH